MGNCCAKKQFREPDQPVLVVELPSAKGREQYKRSGKRPSSIEKVKKKNIVDIEVKKEDVRSNVAHDNISYKVPCIYYSILKKATQNFSKKNLLGEGGFGDVHKGYLTHRTMNHAKPNEGKPVAVKRLINRRSQGPEAWKTEVDILGILNHPHVVQLIGCCNEGNHRILVYEYMTKGSLDTFLLRENRKELSWRRRVQIAIGAASGLAYLHTHGKPIIHRDIKASNVLLDSHFHAKISDFGLAKYGPEDENDHLSTKVIGSRGYLAPEYFYRGHLTIKADVYSFGVVLMEILSGSCADKRYSKGIQEDLIERTKFLLCRNTKPELHTVIDKQLGKNIPMEEARIFAELAYQCLSQNPESRPTMTEVVAGLEQLQHNEVGTSTRQNFMVARFSAWPLPSSKRSSGKSGCI
ncbi:probable serine/threonine-protein kinase PBL11 [Humulus lupulus]|uniref:probable serine/threonine-protein kinase PBL11 n=1 Tax=Humulus lupulus TaxID=3486 RepID=UPI002B4122B1|nr:probable serine/threonine-protein kinase PBL11 [Humulus lupulus]